MSEKEFRERLLKIFDKKRLGKYIDTDAEYYINLGTGEEDIENIGDNIKDIDIWIVGGYPLYGHNYAYVPHDYSGDYPYVDREGNSKTFNFDSEESLIQFFKDIGYTETNEIEEVLEEFLKSEKLRVSRTEFLEEMLNIASGGKKFDISKIRESFYTDIIEEAIEDDKIKGIRGNSLINKRLYSDIMYQQVKNYYNNLYFVIDLVLQGVIDDLKKLSHEVANNSKFQEGVQCLLEEVNTIKDKFNKDCELANKDDTENEECFKDGYGTLRIAPRYVDFLDTNILIDKLVKQCKQYNNYSLEEVVEVLFPFFSSNRYDFQYNLQQLKSDYEELSSLVLNNPQYINKNGVPYTQEDIDVYFRNIADEYDIDGFQEEDEYVEDNNQFVNIADIVENVAVKLFRHSKIITNDQIQQEVTDFLDDYAKLGYDIKDIDVEDIVKRVAAYLKILENYELDEYEIKSAKKRM